MLKEEWRPVPHPFSWLEASSHGRIRYKDQSRDLNPIKHSTYPYIYTSAKSRLVFWHKIVALAFLGEKPKGYDIDHIDRDPTNNTPDNLRYRETGANRSDGNRSKRSLDEETVRAIRESKLSTLRADHAFNTTQTVVQHIRQRKTYKDVT